MSALVRNTSAEYKIRGISAGGRFPFSSAAKKMILGFNGYRSPEIGTIVRDLRLKGRKNHY